LVLQLCVAGPHPGLFRRSREAHAELEAPITGEVRRSEQARPQRCAQESELERAGDGHFVPLSEDAMEGMEIRDARFQFTQANRMQSTLQAIASETDT